MPNYNDLKEKLDKALTSFQKEKSECDLVHFRAEHEQLLRISKTFTKMQAAILGNENYLEDVHKKHVEAKHRIGFEIERMRKIIFDDLLLYKSLNEESQVANIIDTYNVKENMEEVMYCERYKNLIKTILRSFKGLIDSEEILLNQIKQINRHDSGFMSICNESIKGRGLDPSLYKYYSSSDEATPVETGNQENIKLDSESIKNTICEKSDSKDESPMDFSDNEIKANMKGSLSKREQQEQKSIEDMIEQAKLDIRNEEEGHRLNLKTVHGLKERIHICFRRFALNKLEMTESLLENYQKMNIENSAKHEITKTISDIESRKKSETHRINKILLRLYKEVNFTKETPEEFDVRRRIENNFLKFNRSILEDKERINDLVLSEIQSVICQGTLEDDNRFLEKLDKQLSDIEKFDTPRFFKISVQMEIAKKYVKDIIYLKKRNFLSLYYHLQQEDHV